jgi:hypothetical protein
MKLDAQISHRQLGFSEQNLATRSKQRLLSLANLSRLEQNRLTQHIALTEGWTLWPLGGFCLVDGSVLYCSNAGWQTLGAAQARAQLQAQQQQPLEVRLFHVFSGADGREKHSIAEARFAFNEHAKHWRLRVEYEAFMDSPLYRFEANTFADLLELNLSDFRVDTPHTNQRWRLEQIALHPDWLELLTVSSAPD